MFITKMSLPRRTFLRGMGATVALPLLDAMVPAFTALAKTPATPQRRFGAVYIPHGAIMDRYTPATAGAGFEFTPILKPLEPFKDHVVVVSNLDRPGDRRQPRHRVGRVAERRDRQEDRRPGLPPRHDGRSGHRQADRPGHAVPVARGGHRGLHRLRRRLQPGYACAYMNTISWASPTTPLPMEINPRVVFERLFGRPGTHGAAARARAAGREHPRFDHRGPRRSRARARAARPSAARPSISTTSARSSSESSGPRAQNGDRRHASLDAPIGVPESYEEHVGLLFDLLAVAYQADLTRVFTFMMAREASMKTYPEIGITEPHHTISHHREKPDVKMAHAIAQHLPHVAVRQVRREAEGDAGRRRLAARPLADLLRQRHEQRATCTGRIRCRSWWSAAGRARATGTSWRRAHAARQMWVACREHVRLSGLDTFGESTGRVERLM